MKQRYQIGQSTKYGTVIAVEYALDDDRRMYWCNEHDRLLNIVPGVHLDETDAARAIRKLAAKLLKKSIKNKGLTKRVKELERRCASALAALQPSSGMQKKQPRVAPACSTSSGPLSPPVPQLWDGTSGKPIPSPPTPEASTPKLKPYFSVGDSDFLQKALLSSWRDPHGPATIAWPGPVKTV